MGPERKHNKNAPGYWRNLLVVKRKTFRDKNLVLLENFDDLWVKVIKALFVISSDSTVDSNTSVNSHAALSSFIISTLS